jgi:hypothetical protein
MNYLIRYSIMSENCSKYLFHFFDMNIMFLETISSGQKDLFCLVTYGAWT